MQKPPLEKIIEKLEKLDFREWSYSRGDPHDSFRREYLKANVRGLIFEIDSYHSRLTIKNQEANTWVLYGDKKSDKKKIDILFGNISTRIAEYKGKEMEENLNGFLTE